jgi:hypothetical protein
MIALDVPSTIAASTGSYQAKRSAAAAKSADATKRATRSSRARRASSSSSKGFTAPTSVRRIPHEASPQGTLHAALDTRPALGY